MMLKWLRFLSYAFAGLGICLLVYVFFLQETRELNHKTRKELPGSFIKLSKGYVRYELAGPENGPVVVMIHGAGSGYYAWDNNFDYLSRNGFRCLRYDLYGRGFSDRPETEYDSTLFVGQLEELIPALGLKVPLHLISVSMGSSIAILFTRKNPLLVRSLTLTDPASLNYGTMPWYLTQPVLGQFLMGVYWYPRAVEKQMKEFYNPSGVQEYREKSREQLKYKGRKRAMLSSWKNMLTLNLENDIKQLGAKGIKMLLVWGENDPLVPAEVSKHYTSLVPASRLVIIGKAGHLSSYERPDIFNKTLLTFLQDEE